MITQAEAGARLAVAAANAEDRDTLALIGRDALRRQRWQFDAAHPQAHVRRRRVWDPATGRVALQNLSPLPSVSTHVQLA